MPDKTLPPEETVIDAFRTCLTGRLVRGIAHNLNGMLQLLSMQTELLRRDIAQDKIKIDNLLSHELQTPDAQNAALALLQDLRGALDKKDERTEELLGVFLRLEGMSEMIADRGKGVKGQTLVEIDRAFKEEIDFLKADLFFKHQVNTILDIPSSPLTILTNERFFKDLIDVTMTMCINQLKPLEKSEKKEIKIVLENDGPQLKLGFEHTGRPFALNEGGGDDRSLECIYPQNEILLWRFVVPIHALLKLIAGKLDAAFQISPQKISFVFTSTI